MVGSISAEEVISDEWPFCFEKYSLWFYKIVAIRSLLSLSLNTGNREDKAPMNGSWIFRWRLLITGDRKAIMNLDDTLFCGEPFFFFF